MFAKTGAQILKYISFIETFYKTKNGDGYTISARFVAIHGSLKRCVCTYTNNVKTTTKNIVNIIYISSL